MHFGLIADGLLIPDPDVVTRRFAAEFERLLYLALMADWEQPMRAATADLVMDGA